MPSKSSAIDVKTCTVCRHPERHRVEMMRVAGVSLDVLAGKFDIHRDAIWRHMRKHCPDDVRASYLADIPIAELTERATRESVSLIDYFALVRSTVIQQLLLAASANDGHRTAVLAGRAVEVLREIGRLTGELRDVAAHAHMTVNNTVIMNSPIFVDLQAMLIERLADYPEALGRVVDGLRALEGRNDGEPLTLPPAATGGDRVAA